MRKVINDDVKRALPGSGSNGGRNHFFLLCWCEFHLTRLVITSKEDKRIHHMLMDYCQNSVLFIAVFSIKVIKYQVPDYSTKMGNISITRVIKNLNIKQLTENSPTKLFSKSLVFNSVFCGCAPYSYTADWTLLIPKWQSKAPPPMGKNTHMQVYNWTTNNFHANLTVQALTIHLELSEKVTTIYIQ